MDFTASQIDSGDTPTGGTDLHLRHLFAHLARIDLLLQRQVRHWQSAGQNANDPFRGLYVADGEATALVSRPPASNWGDAAVLPADEEADFRESERLAMRHASEIAAEARLQSITPRLDHLRDVFQLDAKSLDTLLICLAPALDRRYEKLYGYLQDDISRKWPSIGLIADLLSGPGPDRLAFQTFFGPESSLFANRLLQFAAEDRQTGSSLLSRSLAVDPAIVSWLCGRYQPPAELVGHVVLTLPVETETDQLLGGAVIDSLFEDHFPRPDAGVPALLSFTGPDEESRTAAARMVAARGRRPLLSVGLRGLADPTSSSPIDSLPLRLALRDALLTGAIPFLTGGDALIREGTIEPRVLSELFQHPGLIIVAGNQPWQPQGMARDARFVAVHFPPPSRDRRIELWRAFAGSKLQDTADLSGLAGQFQLTTGQIRDAVMTAGDRAVQENRPLHVDDLYAAARSHSSQNLSSLSFKIIPHYDWADIVLPDDQMALLRELVDMVRLRPQVLDNWGVGRKLVASRGVTALFSGPPGTGKTMAAEVIAGQLGLDLYKINLSSIVSKYIGETEKNLERIFQEATSSNAILFFDEADALFGKRSEVRDSHDRYANIEISYLLQRMEMYDGVTILATNLRANLDEAFARRLNFAVDFPFPDEHYRRRIWQTLLPYDLPHAPDLDFDLLARRYRLAGGNIRNILVSAAYLAAADGQSVTMAHLLHGARRELQKMGRLVGDDELGIG